MVRQPIAETSLSGLRPTGVAGRRVLDCWDQIDSYLRNEHGADLADLFAEPVAQSGRIVWFGPEGKLQHFRDLGPDEQNVLQGALRERVDRLDAAVTRLRGSGDVAARLIGETLELAQQVPGAVEDALCAVNGVPVLINWSLEPEGAPSPKAPLREFVRRAPPPPPRPDTAASPEAPPGGDSPIVPTPPPTPPAPPPPDPVRVKEEPRVAPIPPRADARPFRWWWLLWIIAALLAAAIVYLLIACGPWARTRGCCCPPLASAPTDPEVERAAALSEEIAQLERELGSAPPCSAATPAGSDPSAEFDRRRAEAGATEGDLTITLMWNTSSDLDLLVTCPDGQTTIFYGNKQGCGGSLDVDANLKDQIQERPVENVFFGAGAWSPGIYRVGVINSRHRGPGDRDDFQVEVKKRGQTVVRNGTAVACAVPGRCRPEEAVEVIEVQMP